jgi:hypothetical protein
LRVSGEAANINFIVFAFTRQELKPPIIRTQGEHTYHYTPDAVHANRRADNTKGQMKKDKGTNNYLQHNTQKTMIE